MRLVALCLSFVVFMAACGGMEDDPSTLLAENAESIQFRDDVPAEDGRENGLNLIATLSLDNGHTLDFYEPFPGEVLISEVSMAPNPPLSTMHDLRSMSLVEIHETFAPGQTVPAAIIAAQERLDAPVALESVTGAAIDREPFANHGDVAVSKDANQDDGTKDADANSHPESTGACSRKWFRDSICGQPAYRHFRRTCQLGTGGRTYGFSGRYSFAAATIRLNSGRGASITLNARHGSERDTRFDRLGAGDLGRAVSVSFRRPQGRPAFSMSINGRVEGPGGSIHMATFREH